MVRATSGWGERGQATVEHVGLTLVVALLLAACAAWVVQEVRPPDHLPDVIGQVAAPLEALDVRGVAPTGGLPPNLRVPESRRGEPGMLHSAWDAVVGWGLLNVDGEVQAARGFADEVRTQVQDAIRDPLGTGSRILGLLRGTPPLAPPPATEPSDEPGLVGYLFDAGKRPFRDTFLRMSREVGHWAAQWMAARGVRWLGTRIPGALRVR